jgi:N-dimethylarginine dimethylaminohydrolase
LSEPAAPFDAGEVSVIERTQSSLVAEVLAALAYGEQRGAGRALESVALAPDGRSRTEQQAVAVWEQQNYELIEARLEELGSQSLVELFAPYFDAFFAHTEPADWIEAQTFHYVGDALVSDFADVLVPLTDRVTAEVIKRALGDREGQETFALDELTRAMREDPEARERIRLYAQRVIGEAFTQTARAIEATEGLRTLLGGDEGGKRLVLSMLDRHRHRQRLDRLGIDPIEE